MREEGGVWLILISGFNYWIHGWNLNPVLDHLKFVFIGIYMLSSSMYTHISISNRIRMRWLQSELSNLIDMDHLSILQHWKNRLNSQWIIFDSFVGSFNWIDTSRSHYHCWLEKCNGEIALNFVVILCGTLRCTTMQMLH